MLQGAPPTTRKLRLVPTELALRLPDGLNTEGRNGRRETMWFLLGVMTLLWLASVVWERLQRRKIAVPSVEHIKGIHKEDPALLQKLYSEVCSNWRTLTDVRFKLLGFLPAISVVAWATLLSKASAPSQATVNVSTNDWSDAARAFSLIASVITLALWAYNSRNTQLSSYLRHLGAEIEQAWKFEHGIFLKRPDTPMRLIGGNMAVNLVYAATMTGWLWIAEKLR
jgi:hypothetical protein